MASPAKQLRSIRRPRAESPSFFRYAQGLFRPKIAPNYEYGLITHKYLPDHNEITRIIHRLKARKRRGTCVRIIRYISPVRMHNVKQ